MSHAVTKDAISFILRHPAGLKWSVQGLGMLRLYLSDAVRLHVWDSIARVPGVSDLHDHPWHLDSLIVAGQVNQYRYKELGSAAPGRITLVQKDADIYNSVTIRCGENACTKSDPVEVWLRKGTMEVYGEGQQYRQTKDEIHQSLPLDGTVTLVQRTFTGDRDTARVFWQGVDQWVDAKPRPATEQEIETITKRALERWF